MKKTAVMIMLITLVSKVFGLVRDIVLAYYYGASNITDAYLISTTIPSVLFVIIGTGITASYIPIYTAIEKNEGLEAANSFTSNLNMFLVLFCTIIVMLSWKYSTQIVRLFASGFSGETFEMAINFTRITLFGIYFYSLAYVFSSYLNVKNSFIVPSCMGIVLNSLTIIAIILSVQFRIELLAYGTLFAMVMQFMYLVPFANRKGYSRLGRLDIKDKNLRKMARMVVPVIIGVSVNQINVIVDKTIASGIVVGGISSLNYANKLILFIQGIFVLSLITPVFPMLTEMVVSNYMERFKELLIDVLGAICYCLVPITIGTIVLAKPIIELLFGRGVFDSQAIYLTSTALIFYSIGVTSIGIREVLSRAFYAMQDTRTPMINAAIGMAMNILLNIILSRLIGLGGLALATSIAAIFTSCLMYYSLRQKIGPFGLKRLSSSLMKIISASLITGFVAQICFSYLKVNIGTNNWSVFITIGISGIIYIVLTSFMKVNDIVTIINVIKSKK